MLNWQKHSIAFGQCWKYFDGRKGHTHFNSVSGSTRYGCWIATATPPRTEDVPAWMQSLVESEASTATAASAGAPSEADETVAAARAQPNSVFAIAGDRAAFGVDIDAVHMPAQHLQALADAAPPDDVEVHRPRATRQVLQELEAPKPPTTPVPSPPRNRAERRAAMFGGRGAVRR